MKQSAPSFVSRGAAVVNFLEDSDSNDDHIPCLWRFHPVDLIVPPDLTCDSVIAQPPAEPSRLHLDLTTTPFIDSTTIPPVETERPVPCQSPRPLPPHPTTSGPRAVHLTTSGPSAAHVTASGPSAVHLTTSGPRAAQTTSPGPSANLTTTSTDLVDRARFPPSSPTSHHRRTPTSPVPSDTEINPSAFLAQLYPSVSGCDHDVARSDKDGLSLASKDTANDSRPLLGTVNGQPPGKRNRKLTRAERDKWKIEEARRRGQQMSEADKRAVYNAIRNIPTVCRLQDRWIVVK